MGDRTGIEWTDATWNPQVGCSRVSRGCLHCYAETQARGRLSNVPAYEGTIRNGRFSGRVNLLPERLDQPLRWARPRRIFVNSMSDLFHENVPAEWIARVVAVMALAQWHTFQVLTKRPERMAALLADPEFRALVDAERRSWTLPMAAAQRRRWPTDTWPLPNAWWGVSIENDANTGRADILREASAGVRWISAEPLVGPLPSLSLEGIGWVVAGGESGAGAAPMHPDWARDLRDRCAVAGVPFLFKQWGEHLPAEVVVGDGFVNGAFYVHPIRGGRISAPQIGYRTRGAVRLDARAVAVRVGKRKAGRELDGRTHDDYPEVTP